MSKLFHVVPAPTTSPASSQPPPVSPAKAWARGHRMQAAGGAVAAVAAVALWRKHKAATTASTNPAAAGVDAAGVSTPNTQASDIENWVQDALNSQQSAVNAALAAPGPPAGPAAPPHFIYGALAEGLKYVRDNATGWVYQVNPDGSMYHVGAQQYAALGKPAVVAYGVTPKPKAKPPPPKLHPVSKPKPKPKLITTPSKLIPLPKVIK